MSEQRTFTARLACPTCGVTGQRLIAARDASESGAWDLRVHDCTRCWRLRSQALAIARERLRAAGDLGETSSGKPTWQGAVVREEGHDPISGALVSELLRLGVQPYNGSRMRLSEVALGLLSPVEAA